MAQKLYDAERDTDGYENTVMKHMLAMTTEGLHSKASIAVELAYRDKLLTDSKQRVAELEKELEILSTNFEDKAHRVKELDKQIKHLREALADALRYKRADEKLVDIINGLDEPLPKKPHGRIA